MTNPTKPEAPREHRRLLSVSFVESVPALNEDISAAVGHKDVQSIEPAFMLPDCTWSACDKGQRADGIAVKRIRRDASGRQYIGSAFIPWANVRALSFGE